MLAKIENECFLISFKTNRNCRRNSNDITFGLQKVLYKKNVDMLGLRKSIQMIANKFVWRKLFYDKPVLHWLCSFSLFSHGADTYAVVSSRVELYGIHEAQ